MVFPLCIWQYLSYEALWDHSLCIHLMLLCDLFEMGWWDWKLKKETCSLGNTGLLAPQLVCYFDKTGHQWHLCYNLFAVFSVSCPSPEKEDVSSAATCPLCNSSYLTITLVFALLYTFQVLKAFACLR